MKRTVLLDERTFTIRLDIAAWLTVDAYWEVRDMDPQEHAGAAAAWRSPENVVQYYGFLKTQKETAVQRYRALLQEHHILDVAPGTLAQTIRELQATRDAYKDGWAKQWQALVQLPQLFIAV